MKVITMEDAKRAEKMDDPNSVYVLETEYADANNNTNDIKVFGSFNSALIYARSLVTEYMGEWYENYGPGELTLNFNEDPEQKTFKYEAWENGCYIDNHSRIEITKHEIIVQE